MYILLAIKYTTIASHFYPEGTQLSELYGVLVNNMDLTDVSSSSGNSSYVEFRTPVKYPGMS